jgi:chromosome segregation ATPase
MKTVLERAVQEGAETRTQVSSEKEAAGRVRESVGELEAQLTKRDSDMSLALCELSKAKAELRARDEALAARDTQLQELRAEAAAHKAAAETARGQVRLTHSYSLACVGSQCQQVLVLNDITENLKTELKLLKSQS